MYINTFQYTPEDVDCTLCTRYAGKRRGCKENGCPWLTERIEAGVVGYEEAIMETFPRDDPHMDARLHTAIRRFSGSMFLNAKHRQRMAHLMDKEVNRLKEEKSAQHCIGIAADEAHRCKEDPNIRYPLVEWGITEAQALQLCYDRGFDFGGLYKIYHRPSCWCCPFQRISELRQLRQYHPELWARMLDMDNRARAQFGSCPLGQFRKGWSVERLEERFAREDAQDADTTTK